MTKNLVMTAAKNETFFSSWKSINVIRIYIIVQNNINTAPLQQYIVAMEQCQNHFIILSLPLNWHNFNWLELANS